MRGSDFITGWQTQDGGNHNPSNFNGNDSRFSRYNSANPALQEIITNSYISEHEEEIDQVFDEIEEIESENQGVMSEALARIEQASLYQVLLNHQLLSPGSARPDILDKVQNEIKSFVLERLQILLGMAEEKAVIAKVESPFDEEEVGALKALAQRVLRKDTGSTQVTQPTVKPVVAMAPLTQKAPAIVPVVAHKQSPVAPVEVSAPVKKTAKPVAKTQSKPVAKKTLPQKKEVGEPVNNKPIDMSNLTPEQAAEIASTRKSRKSAVGPTKPIPMPSADIMAMKAQQQIQNLSNNPELLNVVSQTLK